jgi:hypothetical protein
LAELQLPVVSGCSGGKGIASMDDISEQGRKVLKTLSKAILHARELQIADQGEYAVVWSEGFLGQGPYFVVEIEQVPFLVEEGAIVVWKTSRELVSA